MSSKYELSLFLSKSRTAVLSNMLKVLLFSLNTSLRSAGTGEGEGPKPAALVITDLRVTAKYLL